MILIIIMKITILVISRDGKDHDHENNSDENIEQQDDINNY